MGCEQHTNTAVSDLATVSKEAAEVLISGAPGQVLAEDSLAAIGC